MASSGGALDSLSLQLDLEGQLTSHACYMQISDDDGSAGPQDDGSDSSGGPPNPKVRQSCTESQSAKESLLPASVFSHLTIVEHKFVTLCSL